MQHVQYISAKQIQIHQTTRLTRYISYLPSYLVMGTFSVRLTISIG